MEHIENFEWYQAISQRLALRGLAKRGATRSRRMSEPLAFRWMLKLIKNKHKILIYQSDNARVLTQKYLYPYIKLNLLTLQIGGCGI